MAGELITDEMQLEFNGFAAEFRKLDGVRSGKRDTANVRRGRTHGSIPGLVTAPPRVVTALINLQGPTMAARVEAFELAAAADNTEQELVWRLRGDQMRMVYARVVEYDVPIDRDYSVGVAHVVAQWEATDPRIYSTTEQTGSTGPGTTVGGLEFPHGFPHGFGTAVAGSIEAINEGNHPAPWTATLTGPLTSPRITLVGLDGDLSFSGFDLADGDTLTFDSLNRTVLLNGTASRYGSMTTRDWFDIPAGGATVALSATAGNGTLDLAWRDTWL